MCYNFLYFHSWLFLKQFERRQKFLRVFLSRYIGSESELTKSWILIRITLNSERILKVERGIKPWLASVIAILLRPAATRPSKLFFTKGIFSV